MLQNNTGVTPVVGRVEAANVRAEAARIGLTQSDLAAELGVSQQSVSRRLTGEVPFTVDQLRAISRRLGVRLSVLLGEPEAVAG